MHHNLEPKESLEVTFHRIDDVLFDELARFNEVLKSRGTICFFDVLGIADSGFQDLEVPVSGVLGSLVDAERPVRNVPETTGSAVEDGK